MRRDTTKLGDIAEAYAESLLNERGFAVVNLNCESRNHPLYDLVATKGNRSYRISVKCDRELRQISLGSPHMLENLADDAIVMAFITTTKKATIRFESGGYDLLIVPGSIARDEGLAAHRHYASTHPGSASHRVMVKDKVDSSPKTISGAAFRRWYQNYANAWHLLGE